jgi:hypothetical protein
LGVFVAQVTDKGFGGGSNTSVECATVSGLQIFEEF